MEILPFRPDDDETLRAVVDLTNAAQKVDAPFDHPFTVAGYAAMRRHGWDGEVPETFVAWDAEAAVGVVAIHTSEWDNRHLAWLELLVHPDLRGAGRGTELLAFAENRSKELGRTSIGTDGWDAPRTTQFAARHDLPRKGSAIKRRQVMSRLSRPAVDDLVGEARRAAADYELVELRDRTPDELIGAVSEMTAAINDAPTDDLDIEDEVFPVERVRGYENAMLARGHRLYRLVARHRRTGELAGHTVVVVDSERPWIGEQHDTSVVSAHRGHRLGLLLKGEMLRWLAGAEPALETLDTWNMESNRHMIAVNEALGYEVLGRELDFQRSVR